ncbi:MAG TPA: alpha-amylase family glycosyl hydrolase [Kofleriaceae bacterium]|nr:alpha-amylase family glycosyl hydrolase [Kofleriaceae bacterium]
MRCSRVVALACMVTGLAGCPSSQNPGSDDTSDGGTDPDAGTCANPQPTCSVTIRYKGTGTNVVLRGDFAPDGWTVGVPMTKAADGAFEVTLPANDQQVIVYKIVVDGNWIADPDNARKSPDGFGAFNSVVRVDCDHCPARPAIDWRDSIMYFVMIDRFANGDPNNDDPVNSVEYPGQYMGGDFVGLKQKIDEGYFDQLGVNTLWLTSPIDNADNANPGSDGHSYSGYHGYWPRDLNAAESKLGTEAELKAVVDAAHAHGMQVLIDYVMNHVHTQSPIYAQHPDWFWPNDNGFGGNCVCGAGCSWDNDRLKCWFDPFLPDFNFQNGDARRYSVENAVAWAKRIGIDGFRLDAVKHIETSWLTDLRARINAEVAWDQRFYMVGETFDGNRDLIKSYVNPDTMLDGQFDFPLRGQILSTILRRDGSMGDLSGFLAVNDGYYGGGSVMSTFIGNHDVPRAVHLAEDVPLWGSWDGGKERAWSNRPTQPTVASPYERLAVAYTLLFTMPGIPMLYYGDEYGMAGAGDPDNRRFMQWDGYSAAQTKLRDRIAGLAKARAEHPAMRHGTREQLGVTNDVMTYKMTGEGDTVFVVLNRGDGQQQAPGLPGGTYKDAITGETIASPVTLAPRSALVLVQ